MIRTMLPALLCFLLIAGAIRAETPSTDTTPEQQPAADSPSVRQEPAEALRDSAVGELEGLAEADLANEATTASSVLQLVLVATVVSVAPAVAVLMTSFTRIVVVLGILRQALATPQLPPNQVLFGLSLLMTVVVMAPVLQSVHARAIEPLLEGEIEPSEALSAGETPLRRFMFDQLHAAGNTSSIYVFLDEETASRPDLRERDVPTLSLLPAFVLSELKVAFLMGLRIFLPFVMIDMLVGAILVSMGMIMLPPVLVALPLKLLVFVLADGWSLVAGTLMSSFS